MGSLLEDSIVRGRRMPSSVNRSRVARDAYDRSRRDAQPRRSSAAEHRDGCFCHECLFYDGDEQFLRGTLPFLWEALAREEATLVTVGETKQEILREELGGRAEQIFFMDALTMASNPARIIPAWRRFLEDHGGEACPVRGIAEPVWPGRSSDELTECRRHESLLNLAFEDGHAWRLMCCYDLAGLDQQVIEAAEHNHPFIVREGIRCASEAYARSRDAHEHFGGTLSLPRSLPSEATFTLDSLRTLRTFVHQQATDASLDAARTEDLVLAVNELASNSILHGGGEGIARIWRDADKLLCEVSDEGHMTKPLVGCVLPTPDLHTGRGLWLVNHLCDLVQIRSSPSGSVVRVHMCLN